MGTRQPNKGRDIRPQKAAAVRQHRGMRRAVCQMMESLSLLVVLCALIGSVLALANLHGHQCQFVFPKAVPCFLKEHDQLAGSLIGAAGTIFAGWLAWLGVQRQIERQHDAIVEQRRATDFTEQVFFAGRRDRIEQELAALGAAHRIISPPASELKLHLEAPLDPMSLMRIWNEASAPIGGVPTSTDERVALIRGTAPLHITFELLQLLQWHSVLNRRMPGQDFEVHELARRAGAALVSLDGMISAEIRLREYIRSKIDERSQLGGNASK